MKSPFPRSRTFAILLSIIAFLAGLLLVMTGVSVRGDHFLAVFLTTVGTALVVSVSTGITHRYLTYSFHYQEMQRLTEERLHRLLNERFDLLESTEQAGIRSYYPKWSTFCENTLPHFVDTLESSFQAVGIGLSNLALQCVSGRLGELIATQLGSQKSFTFCTVNPESSATTEREQELEVEYSTSSAISASLAYLGDIKRANNGRSFSILTLKSKLPKGTIICIDERVIFYSPYLSFARTPLGGVIETHFGDELFKTLKKELDHLLDDAVEWPWAAQDKTQAGIE